MNPENVPKLSAALVALLLILGVALPLLSYNSNLWDHEGATISGTSIEESVFGEYAIDTRDSAIFPDAYKIESARPFLVARDYSRFEVTLSSQSAIEIAEEFLEEVGPSPVVWMLHTVANMSQPPSWKVSFQHVDFSAYVIVDAVTGAILEYESKYLHDFDPTPLTLEEAENLTEGFLRSYDIEIPSTANYIKGEPYDCQRFYSLVFQEYVGPIKVEDSSIVVRASAFTRGISYYSYDWIGIDDIDTSLIVDEETAKANALSRYVFPQEVEEVSYESSVLSLAEINNEQQEDYRRLCWIIRFETGIEKDVTLFVDAFSGNLFGVRDSLQSFELVQELPTLGSSNVLTGIALASAATSILTALAGVWFWKRT